MLPSMKREGRGDASVLALRDFPTDQRSEARLGATGAAGDSLRLDRFRLWDSSSLTSGWGGYSG